MPRTRKHAFADSVFMPLLLKIAPQPIREVVGTPNPERADRPVLGLTASAS